MSFTAYDISTIRNTDGGIATVEAIGVDEHGCLLVPIPGRGRPTRLVDSDKWFRNRQEAFTRVMERLEAAINKKQTELNQLIEMRSKIHFEEDNAQQGDD